MIATGMEHAKTSSVYSMKLAFGMSDSDFANIPTTGAMGTAWTNLTEPEIKAGYTGFDITQLIGLNYGAIGTNTPVPLTETLK